MAWTDDQAFESNWWGLCTNTYHEETKQLVYAKRMGLFPEMVEGKYPVYDLKGKTVLDVGGGPVSLLLKCVNVKGTVVDPCTYPTWVSVRYAEAGIDYKKVPAEDMVFRDRFDEAWCYNVLQHVKDPQQIIQNMKDYAKVIRLFEWVNMPVSDGHPHTLTEDKLNEWLGGEGKVETMNESGCKGDAYYGIFVGNEISSVISGTPPSV